ncbi:cysteine-rich CWC family protein [Hydrogenophaga sp.]|uniref:cysteine-rich CWC family protein n=1 Tax=Hydrogenophaga sp. TaxID=1904254 RepID=UPI002FC94DE2
MSPPVDSVFPDPSRCPLCGGDNRCAMEIERDTGEAQPPCWCVDANFSPELFARIPTEARGQACICAACVAEALRVRETD